MINLSGVSQTFRGRQIFNKLSWNIKKGRKYGLIGSNGTGKTTLLNVISNNLDPEEGTINISGKVVVGYLPQDLNYKIKDSSIIEEALQGLENSSEQLSFENYKYKAEKILMGLGFKASQLGDLASTLSGGWKMRVELAKILLKEPNVLLLDEPTNHLDIESIEWIENYLNSYNGTIVIVSHDKYLIDRLVDSIAELEDGIITEFKGNYSEYLNQKEAIKEIQLATFNNQQRKVEQIERFIERFRYKDSKAKQVQSRIKMLEKMESIEAPSAAVKSIKLKFPEAPRSGKVVYELSKFSKQYKINDVINVVFENSGPLKVERGDKIAVAGKNGQGKTTLSKIIVGRESFDGEGDVGYNVKVAYYAQNQTETLNLDNTVYDELRSEAPRMNETQLRTVLGSFLFKEEDLDKKIKVLSGGEKSRVALCKMLISPTNFLILDEPTNHLDIQSKDILLEALRDYSGTFLIISHDRYFIDSLVNKVWYVENKEVHTHLGNYSEFIQKYKDKLSVHSGANDRRAKDKKTDKNDKKIEAEQRNRLYRELIEKGIENMINWKELSERQLKNGLIDLEKRIAETEKKKEKIEKGMTETEFYKEGDRVLKYRDDIGKLNNDLKKMYERWDDLQDYLD